MNETSLVYRRLRAIELFVVRAERALLLVTLVAMVICLACAVATRLMRVTAPWTNEAAQLLLVWLMFLGANLGFYYREHVGMTAFIDRLGRRARLFFLYLGQVGVMTFCAYIVIVGGKFVIFQKTMGGTTISLPLDIPRYVIASMLPVSFLIGLFHLAIQLFEIGKQVDAPGIIQGEGALMPGQGFGEAR
jgi:TRAP-type C4-dicarboxylate transport system permease small subunit